jgi:hypothetical protein
VIYGSASSILVQICRTGLLVLFLGIAIYCGMSWLAGIDGVQFLLGGVLALPLAAFCFVHVVLALRSDSFPYGRTEVRRSVEPAWFWGLVLFEGAMAGLSVWLGIWAVLQFL